VALLPAQLPPPLPPPGWEEIEEITPGAASVLAEVACNLGLGDERTALTDLLIAAIRIDIGWRLAGVEANLCSAVAVLRTTVQYWRTPLAEQRLDDLANAQQVANESFEEILQYFGPAPETPDPLREGRLDDHDYRDALINEALRRANDDSRVALALLLGAVVDRTIRIAHSEQAGGSPRIAKAAAILGVVTESLERDAEFIRERLGATPLGGRCRESATFARSLLEHFKNNPATRPVREADVVEDDEPFGDDA
jgi:hypothetical protein